MTKSLTCGIHHIGLSVSRLEETAGFFTGCLGWSEMRKDPDYPAIFVTDGKNMVSLWGMVQAEDIHGFNRKKNTGLHHVALEVDSMARLQMICRIMEKAPGVTIEFPPELVRGGPAMHMMCYEPSGVRVEFVWPGYSE